MGWQPLAERPYLHPGAKDNPDVGQAIVKFQHWKNAKFGKNMLKLIFILLSAMLGGYAWAADYISSNGYSGLGLVPSATAMSPGTASINYDKNLPGAINPTGFNTQVGFGLTDGFEIIGRLATNDTNCNMFRADACPPNNIRDFSASLKWSIQNDWLKSHDSQIAIGANDVGGAASYFKSYYMVGTKSTPDFDFSVGHALAKTERALLSGTFGAVTWKPAPWAQLGVQKINENSWATAGVSLPIMATGANAWFTYNQSLNATPLTENKWLSFGVSIPMDRAASHQIPAVSSLGKPRAAQAIKPADLLGKLTQKGFFNSKIGKASDGTVVVEVDAAAYQWNLLDAAGTALGLVTRAYADDPQQNLEVVVKYRGATQLSVSGNATCVKKWLETDEWCESLRLRSTLESGYEATAVTWEESPTWAFRPELILTPTLVSTYGTEYGAFDIDLGINANVVVPLWQGAYWDLNQTYPLNARTENFEEGKPFFGSRLKEVTSRRMLHQILNAPSVNTQLRLSAGMAYNVWNGTQVETLSQTSNGRHRLGLSVGAFSTDTLTINNKKDYQLVSYRYAYADNQKTTTEITNGRFWGGDTGFQLGQRFWHGDTALMLYVKRSRLNDTDPLVSFAGIQLSIPLTPRKNAGFEHLLVRGGNQWVYTIESRILEKENRLTFGYGEIPKTGDTLPQIMNRDRNSSAYYQSTANRLKNAYFNFGAD